MSTNKPTVAVFFGGHADTHDLSQETGYWMCNYIPRTQYRVVPVHVTPEGTWQVPLGSLPQQGPVDRMLHMLFSALRPLPPTQAMERLLAHPIAALMTTLRGTGGDDGALQSLGAALGIPVVGSPSATCQQTAHKQLCAARVDDIVASPYSLQFTAHRAVADIVAQVGGVLAPPFFVKPASEEGSAGVTQVNDMNMLAAAITAAQPHGDILVQEKAEGDELSITILEDEQGRLQVLPPTLVALKKAPFYDHLAKRRAGRVVLHTPEAHHNAVLDEAITIARDVYTHLGCRGYASLDMIASEAGIQLLEVNTVPTFTAVTPLKHQLQAAGVHPTAMVSNLLKQTLH